MDSGSQVQESLSSFPVKLPESAVSALFSKKNIERVIEKSKQLNQKQGAAQVPEKTSLKRASDSPDSMPLSFLKSSRQFDTVLLSRLTQWESLDPSLTARKSLVRERLPQLYELYCRVRDCGGYFKVLGYDLWTRIETDLGLERLTAREAYEDFVAPVDATLHPGNDPNPTYWPLNKLRRTKIVPQLCIPESRKELRNLLPLPCFVLREDVLPGLSSLKDLRTWAIDTLRLSPIRFPATPLSITSSEVLIDTSQYYGLPVLCLNSGPSPCSVRILAHDDATGQESEGDHQRYSYVLQDPGDLLFVQGMVQIAFKCDEGSSEITTLWGLSQHAGRLISSIDTAKVGKVHGVIPLFSLVAELISSDTPLLSMRGRFLLAEKLLEEVSDYEARNTPVELTDAHHCALCCRPLFCMGRKCACGVVLCRNCRGWERPHPCVGAQYVWVQTSECKDVNKTIATLEAIQQNYSFSLSVSTTRKRYVSCKSEPEYSNGHRS